ncbi:MAG: hypothetical protein JWN43_2295 [Gammaproteobacteria bacterium]|nr:hypothetical protein [Gammaproteobacteria bacterium]
MGRRRTTTLVDSLGITYPIIQAGTGNVAGSELVAAVSEAGGLGVLGGAECEPEELRREIQNVRSLTSRPFGVDLLIAAVNGPEPRPESLSLPAFAYPEKVRAQIQVLFEERVPVFVSGLGNPGPYVDQAHGQGMVVMALVGTVDAAHKVAEAGVDYVIAQGHEAGGHTGRIGTMALVPAIDDAVDVPVLAAGGIVDGRGVLAAMALGAVGVWVGTRFVATLESRAHEKFKRQILHSGTSDTTVTRAYTGKTARALVNDYTRRWDAQPEKIKPFPHQFLESREHFSGAMRGGDVNQGFMPAGQAAGLIHDIPRAADVVRRFVDGMADGFASLSSTLASVDGVVVKGHNP